MNLVIAALFVWAARAHGFLKVLPANMLDALLWRFLPRSAPRTPRKA
jgi:hypothetical protein